ncbi:MAG: protease pro-enzyme activation domain-containing protein [bacterium]
MMRLSRPRTVLVASVALALAASLGLAGRAADAAPTEASAPSRGTSSAVDPEVTFTVALPYDRGRLHRAVQRVSTPGSAEYRRFPRLAEAAARYGATPGQRAALVAWASGRGMSVRFDRTGLTARVTGPASAWERVYGKELAVGEGLPTPRVMSRYIPGDLPESFESRTPSSMRGVVRSIIPVSSELLPATRATVTPPDNEGSPFGPGEDCFTPAALARYTYSPSQLHAPYGTAALHASGDRGRGARLAIVGLGQSFAPGLAEKAGECFDYRVPRVSVTGAFGMPDRPVQNGGQAGVQDAESNLDVQTSAAVLPDARRLHFVEAADGGSFVLALVDGFTAALERLDPDVITLSYGLCDPLMKETGDWPLRSMSDDVFAMAALVGTSVLVASGDSGSSACWHQGLQKKGLQAAYPSSSPWVTAVGGTRIVLGTGNARVEELAWNDQQWDPAGTGAGTGGPTAYPSPWYQSPITAQNRRIVPDLAAHASEFPGWPVALTPLQYEMVVGVAPPPGATWGMAPVGGTSASTPFTAANIALIAARHGRLGLLNPWLYSIGGSAAYREAFYDVVRGNNQVSPPAACCRAERGYDAATGLGAPMFDVLARLVVPPGR